MEQIRALPYNGLRVVSTFSGMGGSSLGLRQAGFKILWANEFVELAAETYRANHLGVVVNTSDIRTLNAATIRAEAGLDADEDIDVLEGSPPCSDFSMCGNREAGWGKTKSYSRQSSDGANDQRVDDLFWQYNRLLSELRPRAFIAENVKGLMIGVAKGYLHAILADMRRCGYKVKAELLNAAHYGAATLRQRVIFVGIRDDIASEFFFPKPTPYLYTFHDACGNGVADPHEGMG
jgi:DNA (cytosine-5)-methyltransferase 1